MIPIIRCKDSEALKSRVMNRSQLTNDAVTATVKEIIRRVHEEGDAALYDYTARFDHVQLSADTVQVTLRLDGVVVVDEPDVPLADEYVNASLEGSGTMTMDVYFDGVWAYNQTVNFG